MNATAVRIVAATAFAEHHLPSREFVHLDLVVSALRTLKVLGLIFPILISTIGTVGFAMLDLTPHKKLL